MITNLRVCGPSFEALFKLPLSPGYTELHLCLLQSFVKFPIVSRCLLLLLLLTDVVAHVAGLTPNTTYRVSIRAKNIKASPYVDEKSLIRLLEKLSAHTEFRTLKKGKNISKQIHKISFL